jgi:flagellar motor protein MotB
MKRCTLMLIFLTMFGTLAVSQENKDVIVKGVIRDLKNKMPLAAQIRIIYKDSQLEIQETTAKGDGSFELKTFQKNFILQTKADGYIVSNVMMNLENPLIPALAVIEVPLVLSSRPKSNQYIVEFKEKKQGETANKEAHNKQIFQALDAVDGKLIAANFRLIGSDRSEIMNIKTSVEESVFEHDFTKKDNLLLEVTADGYQKFLDNVVIDKFDEIAHENTAKLIKSVSFLNLVVIIKNRNKGEVPNVSLVENTSQKAIKLSNNSGDLYFGMLEIGKSYHIKVNIKDTEEITKDFVALEGVNQIMIIPESLTKSEVETKVLQVEKMAFKPESKAMNFEMQTIFFDQSSTVLKLESPDVKVEITGHTDNIGDTRQNLYLSEFRAKVISSFLFNKGIKNDRILLKGDGSKQPNTGNDTEENRQKNRRAELRFY